MGRKGTGVTIVSDSSYEIAFTYKGKRCRERVKAKPCPANTRKLIQFRAAVLHAIEKGEFDYAKTFPDSRHAAALADRPGDVQTVEDYFDKWLKRKKVEIKASTYKGYEPDRQSMGHSQVREAGPIRHEARTDSGLAGND